MAKRILVVDDDPDMRQAMQAVLSSAGYEVLQAANRREAMQELRPQQIDLVLLDVMMETGTEGFHLAYEIRRDEKLKDIPIIVLSCVEERTGLSIDLEKSGDYLPVQAFLRKPPDLDELKAQVAKLLA